MKTTTRHLKFSTREKNSRRLSSRRSLFNINFSYRNTTASDLWSKACGRIDNRWCSYLKIVFRKWVKQKRKCQRTTKNRSQRSISSWIFSIVSGQSDSPNQTTYGRTKDWHWRQLGRSFTAISVPVSFGKLIYWIEINMVVLWKKEEKR